MFIFSYAFAIMKPKLKLVLFSAFQGAYPGLLSETNLVCMQTVFQIHLLSISLIRKVIEMDYNQTMSGF